MKILKFISAFLISVVLIFAFFVTAFCEEYESDELLEGYGEEIYSVLDEKTRETLSSFGLDELSFNSVFDLSFSECIKGIGNIFTSSVKDIIPGFFKILAMLVLMSATAELRREKGGEKDIVSSVFSMIVILLSASLLKDTLEQTLAAFSMTSKLLLLLAPIITALLSLSGNVTASALYNSVTVVSAQVISSVSSEILLPLIGVYFSFVISFELGANAKGERVIHSFNKLLTGVFTAMSTAFTLILSIKNVLAKELDSVLYKSGKYIISGFVPVVGSTVSAILSSVIGSIDLMKSTVAIFGVICVIAVNLPVLLKLGACYIAFEILATVSDFFGVASASSTAKGFSSGVKLMTAMVFFEVVLVIISLGLTVAIKGAS